MIGPRPGRGTRLALWLPLGWLVATIAVPTGLVLLLAFRRLADRIPPVEPLWSQAAGHGRLNLSLESIVAVATDPLYAAAFGHALANALATTLLCVLIGYPLAYAIALAPARRRPFYLLLAVVPFWTSFLMRTYAWMGLLRDSGPVNSLLLALHLADRPVHLLYSPAGVLIVMVYSYLPFFLLPMYAVLERLPREVLEAAADLGARPFYAFRTVTLPLSLRGLLAGAVLVFIPAMGEYIIPDLVGNTQTILIGGVLWNEFFQNRDWPTAAAIALLTTLTIALPFAAGALLRRRLRAA
ncbi:MAG: ABC transporter permease [Proteobacteria bacterium]|nr:ABC transporter permease [Pseudomonadota bacterium]